MISAFGDDPWSLAINQAFVRLVTLVKSGCDYQAGEDRINLNPSQSPTLRRTLYFLFGCVLLAFGLEERKESVKAQNFMDDLKFFSLAGAGVLMGLAVLPS
jgi:hypothetical protein